MAWLLLLLIPLVGLPVLRMALFPARRGPAVPWIPLAIGAGLLVLWLSFGQPGADPAETYAQADSAMRALIE